MIVEGVIKISRKIFKKSVGISSNLSEEQTQWHKEYCKLDYSFKSKHFSAVEREQVLRRMRIL